MTRICIVVEGMDRTGKTTFIERLKEAMPGPWVTIHNSRQPDTDPLTPASMYACQISMVKTNPEHWYIFDRLHISETVYSRLYRVDNASMVFIDGRLPTHTLLVLCEREGMDFVRDDDGESTWAEYDGDPDIEKAAFRGACHRSRHRSIRIDPVNKTDQAVIAVMEALHLLQQEVDA